MKTQHVHSFSAIYDKLSFNYVALGAAIKRIEAGAIFLYAPELSD